MQPYRARHPQYDEAVRRLESHRRPHTPPPRSSISVDTDRIIRNSTIDDVLKEAEDVAFASEAAVRRMLATTGATEQVGAEMLRELDRQGDVLARTQNNVDKIRDVQPVAQRELRSIASVSGQVYNAVAPQRATSAHNTNEQVSKKQRKIDAKAQKKAKVLEESICASQIPPELSVLSPAAQAAVARSETDLEELSRRLNNLRQMAVTIGEEFDRQEPQLTALSRTESSASKAIGSNIRRVNNC